MVQGLFGFDGDRSRTEHAHPPGFGVNVYERSGGPRMGCPSMTKTEIDSDVQGLVRFGYGKLRGASYALVRVRNQVAAKSWLRDAKVSDATMESPPPSTALQVAFTAEGLTALGVPPAIVNNFSPEFFTGM